MKMHDNYLMSFQINHDVATELAALVEQGTPGAKVHVSDNWIEQVREFARTDETGEPYYQMLIVDENFNQNSCLEGETELFLAESLDMGMVSRGFDDAFEIQVGEFWGGTGSGYNNHRIDKTGALAPMPSEDVCEHASILINDNGMSVAEVEQELGL